LTCKEKVDRDVASAEHPSGIVKWHVEVFDANFENRPEHQKTAKDSPLVAVATILTMVQKKQETFVEMTDNKIEECLAKLTADAKPKWGIMTPQHMIEHLEYTYKIASGEIQDFEIATPEKILDKVHASLYSYDKFPQNSQFPQLEKDKLDDLKHPDLETAIEKFKEQRQKYLEFFKENPEAKLKNLVFGELNRYESYLLERKHLNHHFEQFGLI
jgi:oxepin-CoA hydrolase/3-oxo-5,6-dehydrosuberyl-CoA semialdehyde dehydrogenase